MKKTSTKKDFDHYIDEYLYYCQSRRLRQKTMQSYEQSLRLFERRRDYRQPVSITTINNYICG